MTRDRIAACLWPESTSPEARHLVADVVYILRKELGDGCLATTGASVCLDPAGIDCDVAEFRACFDSGAWERMLQLYEGPFLDGFQGAGGAEFQRWVADERLRCQEVALIAVSHLVERCEAGGDIAGAIRWLQRGRSVDPFDEEITRRMMDLLVRLGNEAGAVKAYEVLEHRLHRDLDLDPSPETCTLYALIRRRNRHRAAVP